MKPLKDYQKNHYSQNGEDGVIEEILSRLGLRVNADFWCVEVGAWDGIHLSNTFSLVKSGSARVVSIEGDTDKFVSLVETSKRWPSIIPVEAYAISDPTGHITEGPTQRFTGSYDRKSMDTIDNLLRATNCPREFDFLSIDIDSADLSIFESVKKYSPKIVCIEIAARYPPGVLKWHSADAPGNSFSSTLNVARSKGYSLVCCIGGNMIFVREDLVGKLGISDLDLRFPERLFDERGLPGHRSARNLIVKRLRDWLRRALDI